MGLRAHIDSSSIFQIQDHGFVQPHPSATVPAILNEWDCGQVHLPSLPNVPYPHPVPHSSFSSPLLCIRYFAPTACPPPSHSAGKTTQSVLLAQQYGLPHINVGDLLFDEVAAKTELGLEAKVFMDASKTVPDRYVGCAIERACPLCISTKRSVKGSSIGFLRLCWIMSVVQ